MMRGRSRLLVGVSPGRVRVLSRRRTSRSQTRPGRRRHRSLFRQVALVRARQQLSVRRRAPRALLLRLVGRLLLMLLLLRPVAGDRGRPMRRGRSRAIAGNAPGRCVQLGRLQILHRANARRGTPSGSRR